MTMSDLKSVLERGLRGFEPSDDAFERTLRRRDRKRRNQRIAAGVVGIAVFVAAVWIVTSVSSLDRSETPVVPGGDVTGPAVTGPAETAPEPAYLIDLNTGEETQLLKSIVGCCYASSPDGTRVAYISLDDAGRQQLFIARLDGSDVRQVTHDQRWAGGAPLDWSPDGAAIAYTSGWDEEVINIFVLDLATGETSQVTHEEPQTKTCLGCAPLGAAYPQFSPDGASIVYEVSRDGEHVSVRIVPVTGGKSVLLPGTGMGTISPDGSTLAVRCSDGICVAQADGTNLRVLVSGPSLFGPEWSPDGTRIAYGDQADGPTGNKVFVVDVATGETTFVADGFVNDWLDDHTLIIEPVPQ
jgi:Tol biopolymer transport system component